jgi:hypothetical protein
VPFVKTTLNNFRPNLSPTISGPVNQNQPSRKCGLGGTQRGRVPGRPGERERRGGEGGGEGGVGLDERVEGPRRRRGGEEAERGEEGEEEGQRRDGGSKARGPRERQREVAPAEREREGRRARGGIEESREVRVVHRVPVAAGGGSSPRGQAGRHVQVLDGGGRRQRPIVFLRPSQSESAQPECGLGGTHRSVRHQPGPA